MLYGHFILIKVKIAKTAVIIQGIVIQYDKSGYKGHHMKLPTQPFQPTQSNCKSFIQNLANTANLYEYSLPKFEGFKFIET